MEKNVITVYVRGDRYIKEFLDGANQFSVTFFSSEYKEKITYLGTVSSRDEDKISKAGLTLEHVDDIPTFVETSITFLAKKLYAKEFKYDLFFDEATRDNIYSEGVSLHTAYVGEIVKVLEQG